VEDEIESLAIYGPVVGGYGRNIRGKRILTLCQSGDKHLDCKKLSESACIRNDLNLDCGVIECIITDTNKNYDFIVDGNYRYSDIVYNILQKPNNYYIALKSKKSNGNLLFQFL
jgi:hypothetical protein